MNKQVLCSHCGRVTLALVMWYYEPGSLHTALAGRQHVQHCSYLSLSSITLLA